MLGLRNNPIAALPEWIGGLPELIHLDLRGNRLLHLPPSLADLPKLQKLDLRWNKLVSDGGVPARLEERGCVVLQ